MDEVRKGSGLQNIKKRTAMLNGNVTINSTLGAGTQINIEIPL
jgi:signal transduction histidine kinase